jgi:hypothetical protein
VPVVGLAAVGANRVVFDAVNSTGHYCKARTHAGPGDPAVFETNNICWPLRIDVKKGARYRITLTTAGNWFDASERADVGGFPTDTPIHFAAALLKLRWFEEWFKPIAKIGEQGGEEYVLDPVAPFAGYRYKNDRVGVGRHTLPINDAEAATFMNSDPTPDDRKTLTAEITAKSDGELFLYVNDAVLGWPLDS